MDALCDQGRILQQQQRKPNDAVRTLVSVTPAGYLRLEEIRKDLASNDRVFVAMWFDASMDKPYDEGLHLGIRNAGYTPVRLDREPAHGDRIDAKIIVEIRRSRALVVDATELRPNVMYEAGFADGLGLPVIWTVRKDFVDKLPFDTRQLLHVCWETPADLAEQLRWIVEQRLGSRNRKQL